METSKTKEYPLIATIYVEVQAELKELAFRAAEAENMPLNHLVARLLAKHVKRPELASIPYKRMGRPRKHLAK